MSIPEHKTPSFFDISSGSAGPGVEGMVFLPRASGRTDQGQYQGGNIYPVEQDYADVVVSEEES